MHRLWSLAMASPETIRASVAAADDDDALASSQNIRAFGQNIAFATPVLLRQEFHREVDSVELPSPHLQVARLFGSTSENDRVKVTPQLFNWDVLTDMCVGDELHALGFHLRKPAVNDFFLHLEFWNPIAQQPTDAVGLLIHSDGMAGSAQLLSCREPRCSGTYNCRLFSAAMPRQFRPDRP